MQVKFETSRCNSWRWASSIWCVRSRSASGRNKADTVAKAAAAAAATVELDEDEENEEGEVDLRSGDKGRIESYATKGGEGSPGSEMGGRRFPCSVVNGFNKLAKLEDFEG